MSAPGTPRVSVVIPSYQRRESLRRALAALARQTLAPSDYEVVVSLDGSSDGSREMVAAFPAPYALRALWQPNRGRASACNAGIQASRGEVIVVLDDDMEPAPGCLAAHLAAHEAETRVGVIGAAPIAVEPSAPPVVEYVGAKFNAHLARLGRRDTRIDVRDFYSGNFSIRRRLLESVGGYDDAFQSYGNEDGELAIRLLAAGVRLQFSADALARQHYEKDFPALARDNLAKGRTAVLCARMHPEVVGRLRLGTYRAGSRRRRLVRAALLRASHLLPAVPDGVVWVVTWLERRRWRRPSRRLRATYALALDYFFWLGAERARDAEASASLTRRTSTSAPAPAARHGDVRASGPA